MVSFSRGSSLFRASRVQLGLLRLFSCGDLRWLRDVTGESSPLQSLNSWLRYGFGTALDPLRWLVSLRESPAGRLPGQPCARLSAPSSGAPESCKREERREGGAPLARRFKQSVFLDIPKGGWSNQSVGTGRSPACPAGFCKAFSMEKRITFDPCIKTFIKFTHL